MFGTLLESSHRRRRRARVAVVSLAAHAVAITLASAATRHGPPPAPAARLDTAIFMLPPAPEPTPGRARVHGGAAGPAGPTSAPPDHVSTGVPPIGPITIGEVDPVVGTAAPGDRLDRPSGDGNATGATPVAGPDGVFSVVEKPAAALPGAPRAQYPEVLQRASIAGEVLLRFVVDSAGRVEPGSVVTLRASHPLFADAACRALLATRFAPAEVGGRRVRQLAEQTYAFTIDP